MTVGIEAKAVRLLGQGAVTVRRVTDEEVIASVRGDHGNHLVAWRVSGDWQCSCKSWRRVCSHIAAVERVVDRVNRRVEA